MIKQNDIDIISSHLASKISKTPFTYKPKRGDNTTSCTGWDQRLLGYRWKSKSNPFHDWDFITKISDELSEYSQKITLRQTVTPTDIKNTISNTINLFKWGGVIRRHESPSITDINNVMLTAVSYDDSYNAPLDSAWTKLAALSTSWKENDELPPQIIFDSRVSVSILNNLAQISQTDKSIEPLIYNLKTNGLGYVNGRGGNRANYVNVLQQKGWKSGYKKWKSQFIASRIANGIVHHLNKDYPPMPTPNGLSRWTTRGVEMVLFMDGY